MPRAEGGTEGTANGTAEGTAEAVRGRAQQALERAGFMTYEVPGG
ncbi:hypothetical protein ABT391_13400 [Streptomyces jumonjinensis]